MQTNKQILETKHWEVSNPVVFPVRFSDFTVLPFPPPLKLPTTLIVFLNAPCFS